MNDTNFMSFIVIYRVSYLCIEISLTLKNQGTLIILNFNKNYF